MFFKDKFLDEKGQGLTEYALLLGIIAVAVVGTLTLFGNVIIDTFFTIINDSMSGL